ncbi:hypothetical protein V5F63_25770 [Xanthobacter autotrophicus DSM 597]|uniref:hypothetical protein n=1 Tax=Xanthobacter wiegelii TaxID=3119913 RepID=UPI00372BF9C4
MPFRAWKMGAALFGWIAILPAATAHAEDLATTPAPAAEPAQGAAPEVKPAPAPAAAPSSTTVPADPSLTRQAIAWSQERLAELDASVLVVEKNASELKGAVKAKADAAVKQLQETRDAYRAKAEAMLDNSRTWTAAQITDARKSLDDSWKTFQKEVDTYLDEVHADFDTRKAVLLAQVEARQKALESTISKLKADAGKLAQDQRAAVDKQIAALEKKVEELKARAASLKKASASSWDKAKQAYEDVRTRVVETYQSIRDSLSDAMK